MFQTCQLWCVKGSWILRCNFQHGQHIAEALTLRASPQLLVTSDWAFELLYGGN